MITIALLVFGVLNVATSIPQFADFGRVLDDAYSAAGIGDYTSAGLAGGVGLALNVIQIVLILIAVLVAVPRLRANRLAFWVPLTVFAIWVVG